MRLTQAEIFNYRPNYIFDTEPILASIYTNFNDELRQLTLSNKKEN